MRHMKRMTALALALCMALALVSCGEGGGQPAPAKSGAGSSTAAPGASGGSVEGGLTEAERAKEFITVATGPTSGIYFPIGGAFATALKDWGYTTSAQSTAASGENIQLIQESGAEIAIAM